LRQYKTLNNKNDPNVQALQLTEGKHAGIIFSYHKVNFEEDKDNDRLKIHFDYEIHDDCGVLFVKKEFEQELGEFLQELIWYGLEKNELIYTGGVDENREDNSEQSDLR
jgi:hypothetical protein